MKNLQLNQSHIILSRMKEVWEGVLSIFDGNQYLTTENEIILPEELRDSLQTLDDKAKQYETNGMLLNHSKQKDVTKTKIEPSRAKKLSKEQVNTVEKLSKKTINPIKEQNYELGDDR